MYIYIYIYTHIYSVELLILLCIPLFILRSLTTDSPPLSIHLPLTLPFFPASGWLMLSYSYACFTP